MKKAVKLFVLIALAILLFCFSQAIAEKNGSCGNNASWTLNEETGLLTITGSGAIKSGWSSDIDGIIEVEIQEGITSISSYTFSGCSSLRSIVIPSSVTSIGECAFSNCIALQSISLPDSITTLYDAAFYGCTNCNFYLPDNITYIHKPNPYASDMNKYGPFYNCQGKIFCSFGSTTAEQLGKAGYGFFTVDNPDVRIKYSDNGDIYATGKNKKAVSVIVPEGVTILDYDAFSGYTAMTSISLPSTLKCVYDRAFDNCSSLKSLTIPSGYSGAVYISTGLTSLQYVSGPKGTFAYFNDGKWGSCGDNAYYHIDSNGALAISGSGEMWDAESSSALFTSFEFAKKTIKVSSVTIAQGITGIGEYAFYNCSELKDIIIPNSVTRIGKDAFTSCYNLESISIPDSVTEIGDPCFNQSTTIIIPICDSYAHKWVKANTSNTIRVETHQDVVVDNAKAATCTEDGLTEGKHCSVCNEVIIQQTTILGGHTLVTDQSLDPTCTETGLTEGKHCSVCGEVFVAQEVISANGHIEVIDEAKTATCTESGLTEGKHCSVCGEVLVAQEEIPAKGHTEVIDEAIAATCTKDGMTEGKHCSVCNEVLVAQEDIPAIGHTEVIDEAIAATCEEDGLTEGKHCSVCNEVLIAQETVAALGHDWVLKEAVPATYYSSGKMEYTCSRDSEHTETIEVPILKSIKRALDNYTYVNIPSEFSPLNNSAYSTVVGMYRKTRRGNIYDLPLILNIQNTKSTVLDVSMEISIEEIFGLSYLGSYSFNGIQFHVGTGYNMTNATREVLILFNTYDSAEDAHTFAYDLFFSTEYEISPSESAIYEKAIKYATILMENTYRIGWYEKNGNWYYIQEYGIPFCDGWLDINGAWYYFNDDGTMATGWLNDGGNWYYINPDGTMLTGWLNVNGTWYYMKSDGTMATGWQEIAGNWYYFETSGAMATGWIEDSGVWYFLNDDGSWDTSATQDNSSQSSNADGWQDVSGEWFYYENSQAVTGWKSIDGTWYFFDASGAMATGWISDGGAWYYFRSSGAMATGWISDGGAWYYFRSSGAMATGWISDGGKWYYFDASGAMTTGWKSINGTWYYFKNSGAMATGWFEDKEAENRLPANQRKALWYWFDNNGQMATGWKEINGQWEMFDNSGVWLYTWDGN